MITFSLITGPAGTGKTWVARALAEEPGTVLVATTGVAAINLGGSTINGLLRYFDTADLQRAYDAKVLHTRLRQLRDKGVSHIVLDEVSMLSGTQLTLLAAAMMNVNQGSSRPIRLTLVGDFSQLPPVNEPYAFESAVWPKVAESITRLTEIRRQDDKDFIEALGAVRVGDAAKALTYFGDKLSTAPLASFEGTTLKARNSEVDTFNDHRLERLEGRVVHFPSSRSGAERREWVHIPHNLLLKIGSLVMILANRREEGEFVYVNGDLGELIEQQNGQAVVRLQRTGQTVAVEMTTRTNTVGGAKSVSVGSVSYMPLRLAWASTVHKCVAVGTQIQTSLCGIVPVEQLAQGLMLPFGRVVATHASVQPAWRIVTSQGYTVVTSAEHRWVTQRGLVSTQDLKVHEDKLQLAVGHPTGGDSFDLETAYWLGMLVGDGSYTDIDDGTLHFASITDQDLGDRFAEIALKLGVQRCSWRKDQRGLHTTSQPLRRQLLKWGLEYVTAPYKRVPSVIWQADSGVWAAFLRGLFDTDGAVGTSGVVFCSASGGLAQDVQTLLLALGITAHHHKYPGRKDPYWQVRVPTRSLAAFKAIIGFGCIRKAKRLAETIPNRSLLTLDNFDVVTTVRSLHVEVPMVDVEITAPHLMAFGPFVGHNSQGLSLDAVQVDIRDRFYTRPSMTYTALSRCRTPQGLRIIGNAKQFMSRCTVDSRVRPWL